MRMHEAPSRLLERFEEALAEGDAPGARRHLDRLRERHPASSERSWAEIGWAETQDDEAPLVALLETHVARWPEDADALHRLGALFLDQGREEAAVAAWLRVRELDTAQDRAAGVGGPDDEAFVVEAAERALEGLPERFRARLENVAVLVEERPAADLVASGFDPRAYGLFDGPVHAQTTAFDPPAQVARIVLYLHNLVADFPEDEDLAAQVEITVIHEVGHYFGLDEDDMARLGVD